MLLWFNTVEDAEPGLSKGAIWIEKGSSKEQDLIYVIK